MERTEKSGKGVLQAQHDGVFRKQPEIKLKIYLEKIPASEISSPVIHKKVTGNKFLQNKSKLYP